MKLEQHVLYAIDDFDGGKKDSALMHACIAVEGTARKLFNKNKIGKKEYKDCLRQYWWLIEPFLGSGINLEETKFSYIPIDNGHGKNITNPDLADIIYHIFRCSDAHAEEVPSKYSLLPVSDGRSEWIMEFPTQTLHMPERVIWALLAVSVFSKANAGIKTEGEHYLEWGSNTLGLGIKKFTIKDWWGRENEVRDFLDSFQHTRVKMAF